MRFPGNPFQEQGQAEVFRTARLSSLSGTSGGPHRQIATQAVFRQTEYGL